MMHYRYHPQVLEELSRHGIRPQPGTPPRLVRAYLNDLYRYEIRKLRARLLRGDIPKPEYAGIVLALKRTYPLLGLPIAMWAAEE